MPRSSASAMTAGKTQAPGCEMEMQLTKSSSSKPWAQVPFARAALAGCNSAFRNREIVARPVLPCLPEIDDDSAHVRLRREQGAAEIIPCTFWPIRSLLREEPHT
jgi:hypothetical protein